MFFKPFNMNQYYELTVLFLIPLLVVLIAVVAGQYLGIYAGRKLKDITDAPIGTVVATAFGLLAFMLAFTFQIVTNRYDARKALLLEEVTNIRTAYLRAGLLKEPLKSDSKKLLVEYTELRLKASRDTMFLKPAIARSHKILDSLWHYTQKLAEEDRSSEIYALFTPSVNDLFDNLN
jgi:ABC-type dipeptide/oligopeptide/nickel transport system permease component